MGLVRGPADPQGSYTPKPGYVAMANMARQLTGAPFVRREPTWSDVYSIIFKRPGGEEVRVMWSLSPRSMPVEARGRLTVVDIMGEEETLQPVNGRVTLRLSDAPVYVRGPVDALPAPDPAAAKALIANSDDDFSDTQGKGNWHYGYFESGATPGEYSPAGFKPFLNFVITDWVRQWSGAPPYLRITDDDQHPGVSEGHQVWAVRRWVSPYSGAVRIRAKFARASSDGDGTGVRVFVDGKPLFAQLLGGGQPVSATFEKVITVRRGTILDFCVDPGPGTNIEYDGTAVKVLVERV
jgi:hypothetical protein